MAMSQGERMARLLEQQGRFRSRQQTTSSWHHTREIVQPKSSAYLQPQNRTIRYAVPNQVVAQGSQVPGSRDVAIGKNTYTEDGGPVGCCAAVVASGTETFGGQEALLQKAQSCICSNEGDKYWLYNGYAIDMSGTLVKGGYCCPLPNLPNTAKTTAAEKCSSCLKFFFPSPAQPRVCQSCGDPALLSNQRYGDAGVPMVPTTKTAF